MINQERQCLQKLLQDPAWKAIEGHIEQRISKLNEERRTKSNEWETLRAVIANEARIEELKQLLKDLEIKAFAIKENETIK